MEKVVQSRPRNLSPLRCPTSEQPWWADAHYFFPLLFGPLAFLATVLPGLEPVLEGHSINHAGLFLQGLFRWVVFSGVGYLVGLMLHWISCLTTAVRVSNLDVTVGEEDEAASPPKPQPVPVALSLGLADVEPGMKLADGVVNERGEQLAASGALLTEAIIDAAREAGVSAVRVEGVKYVIPEQGSGAGPKEDESKAES